MNALEVKSTAAWQPVAAELNEVTGLGEHTFLLTQALLTTVAQGEGAVIFRHLQQVCAAVRGTSVLFVGPHSQKTVLLTQQLLV